MILAGCGTSGPTARVGGSLDAGARTDTGVTDDSSVGNSTEAGPRDSAARDSAATIDAHDARLPDGGAHDATLPEGGAHDATLPEGGARDATLPEGGARDGGRSTETGLGSATGPLASLDSSGNYTVTFQNPAWSFVGSLGVSPTQITTSSGSDAVGPYHEVTFAFSSRRGDHSDTSSKTGAIRSYDQVSAAVFTETYVAATSNTATSFPTFMTYPSVPHHVSYDDTAFAHVDFDALTPDSPFVFFDDDANAFILSAAGNFMNASTVQVPDAGLSSGIDPAIETLPAGFSHRTALVAEPGINHAYATWGSLLTGLSGKTRVASDATPYLGRLGYWTDHGAYYYYQYDDSLGYAGTLTAVRDYFAGIGVPLAYMQLDSWWYPKGAEELWDAGSEGEYLYEADPTLFPDGLAAFKQSLALPLITHARWITPSSPYQTEYTMSQGVSMDPAFWSSIAGYIADGGVEVYEQDWLNENALPATNNLTDQDAFMDNMASGMASVGLDLQYCMPLPRHYLQGSKYANLTTTRVSNDRFGRANYENFLFVSLLTSSLGAWPWADTFDSSETDNLLLATLSAGMVGVGDEIGTASVTNLLQAVRPDGVIVKPDVPIVPTDATFIQEAAGVDTPLIAATYSDFGGWRASYVYAYNTATNVTATFTPATLGYAGEVLVLDYFSGTGQLVDASATFSAPLGSATSSSYYVVVPVGPSGIAFAGDQGKFVSLGKKRITQVSDDGTLSVSVAFASGESSVTLRGYAAFAPTATASAGSVGAVSWSPTTDIFTVSVTPSGDVAAIALQ